MKFYSKRLFVGFTINIFLGIPCSVAIALVLYFFAGIVSGFGDLQYSSFIRPGYLLFMGLETIEDLYLNIKDYYESKRAAKKWDVPHRSVIQAVYRYGLHKYFRNKTAFYAIEKDEFDRLATSVLARAYLTAHVQAVVKQLGRR